MQDKQRTTMHAIECLRETQVQVVQAPTGVHRALQDCMDMRTHR